MKAQRLTDTERALALNAFAKDDETRKWGELVLGCYDEVVEELEFLEARLSAREEELVSRWA